MAFHLKFILYLSYCEQEIHNLLCYSGRIDIAFVGIVLLEKEIHNISNHIFGNGICEAADNLEHFTVCVENIKNLR